MLFRLFVLSFIFTLPGLVNSAESKVYQDFHMSVYRDVQGSVDSLELFTKIEGKRQFFGVSCNRQSPLPLIQVLLFDDEIMSEQTKLVEVVLELDGKTLNETLNGILTVVDNADELSNKVRFELPPKSRSSFRVLQQRYQELLSKLGEGESLVVSLKHRALKEQKMRFSLNGLDALLKPHQAICF